MANFNQRSVIIIFQVKVSLRVPLGGTLVNLATEYGGSVFILKISILVWGEFWFSGFLGRWSHRKAV